MAAHHVTNSAGPIPGAGNARARSGSFLARRVQELLLTTALACIPLLSSATATMAANIGDVIVSPDGTQLTVTEKIPYGVVAQTADGQEYRILDVPAVGSKMEFPTEQGSVEETVAGYWAGTEFVTSFSLDSNGRPVAPNGAPITGIAFGTPAGEDTEAVITSSMEVGTPLDDPGTDVANTDLPGQAGISDIRRAANGKNGRAGALFVPARSGGGGETGESFNIDRPVDGAVTGSGAPGIIIASIGGNGGKGGNSYLGSGGKAGGAAGSGGNVKVTLTGSGKVTTNGDDAHGIVVQSRAGVGGSGGSGYATGGGGSGGSAANGGRVVLRNSLDVTTTGRGAHGIFGQSLGGGAGNGGASYGLFGDGGDSRAGGHGGTVDLANSGTILTTGAGSHGIFAQSIGGQGGDGGSAGGLVSLGGEGARGGNGGTVIVANTGKITTQGTGSDGIFAQSVGGGGGSGGRSNGFVSLGGDGEAGGDGSSVTVTNSGTIITSGTMARGIFAQSVGGGGGSGGRGGGVFSGGGSGGSGGDASIGGSSDTRSFGGAVRVENTGAVITGGDLSSAIQAQSIGGGGGDGGNAGGALLTIGGRGGGGGDAGRVDVVHSGSAATKGADSHGIFAQSVGGGGGNGGWTVGAGLIASVSLGGDGGDGGKGGRVDLTFAGAGDEPAYVSTEGERSRGVFAQSIGGGGGNGGWSVASSVGFMGSAAVALGGSGGKGGAASDVNASGFTEIWTGGDFSEGMLLQSIGGGGGAGGFSIAGTIGVGIGASASVGIGGSGGGGGAAGNVILRDGGGLINTAGDFSTGLLAQSIGGGGGSGGFAVGATAYGGAGLAVTATIGGSGGGGGDGGRVDIDFNGTIVTTGANAAGALLQSIGGGGGAGGFSVAASASGGVGAGAISAGIGGSGGDGGDGGSVSGTIGGGVHTTGDQSGAVVVQSVGGGGGSGGYALAGTISGGLGAGSVSVGIGGAGGKGGDGGTATGRVKGPVLTEGEQSSAFVVQSVGGGGGNGGFSVSGSISGGIGAGAISVGIGGSGGEGGAGGNASGYAEDTIHTTGNQSSGMIVQSIGGGGGAGGFNVSGSIGGGVGAGAASVGLGGKGDSGGDAGTVVAHAASIFTEGNDATGFLAQSVGGGGGSGGFNVSGSIMGAGTGGGAVSVGLGGSGGGGGDGGTVNALVDGDVTTLGDRSNAIVAQSLGGGGGSGGFNVSGGIAAAGTGAGTVNVGLGGSGAGGGDGKRVTLGVTGRTGTAGDGSTAILAQSVGGGGGAGGFNVSGGIAVAGAGAGTIGVSLGGQGGAGGDGGTVALTVEGATGADDDLKIGAITEGDGSAAIVAQSLGGGGGVGGFSVVGGISGAGQGAGNVGVGLGGGGGGGGNAASVTANVDGAVITRGDDAGAILAQSAGGGGGSGGFSVAGGISAAAQGAGNLMVGIGGFGGGGGDGAAVSGIVTGDIFTEGDNSYGLTYQSLGGGGGSGGFNVTGGIAISKMAGTAGLGIGGFGGDGGDAGSVALTHAGNIFTGGEQAHAALIQSVGGGGGAGGFNVTGGITGSQNGSGNIGLGIGGFGGGGGNAGTVVASLTGNVETHGTGSFGALMQSVGGAGGAGGLNVTGGANLTTGNGFSGAVSLGLGGFGGGGGDAAGVTGTVVGDYLTAGADAFGVSAQSIGGGGGSGGINISGAVAVGGGDSAAVTVGVGGFGGSGGDAGAVVLTRTGDTQTEGRNADAVVAQSVGGGGGAGGINVSGSLSATTKSTATGISLGLGGFGGGGGDAGAVTATVTGNVWARGSDGDLITYDEGDDGEIYATRTRSGGSNGVVAQSVGGGGGSGGLNVSGSLALGQPQNSNSRAVTLGVGGFGGAGGDASTVRLAIGAPGADRVQVQANGDNRSAVIAQSVGGGGGAGGINVSGGLTLDAALTVGVGGFGGDGGKGDDVDAVVDADLYAAGSFARGLLAQSVGGGGGAGAINIAGGIQADQYTSEPSLVFGIGGFGGAGNISGDVNVSHNGQIYVEGSDSIGALVQSVAGGGGSGGLNVSGNLSAGHKKSVALAAGVGGTGGTGADAGDVSFNSTGDVIVNGRIVADAGADEDNLEATDYTGGGAGVLVQSIGGGGGVGGINVTGVVSLQGSPVSLGVGGSGGSGGHAGSVTVTRGYAQEGGVETAAPGLIRTFGDGTSGLVAQSVGGGGGQAGANLVLGVKPMGSGAQGQEFAALIAVGGSGAGAGAGDTVDVRHNGTIVTDGAASHGLVAQSIGGGGGNANYNIGAGLMREARLGMSVVVGGATGAAGAGGKVTVDHVGDILTQGENSYGLVAQSIGGGGGNTATSMAMSPGAKSSVSIGIGRKGGIGGEGDTVSVSANGRIQTLGDGSTAILAQSIGGGGGTSSSTSVGVSSENEAGESSSASVEVGIDGGEGAVSGAVGVDFEGIIATTGGEARGIVAQSIGGGGGIAGTAGSTIVMAANSANIAVGGTGGKGAHSDKVRVGNAGMILTEGEASDGILAQSIGGGGGLGGSVRTIGLQVKTKGSTMNTATLSVGGDGGEGAVADSVTVANSGIIATQGDGAFGVRAQSIGGGGGIGGSVISATVQGPYQSQAAELNLGGSGGDGAASGEVVVDNTGLIYTKGIDAVGIGASSIGGGGGDAGVMINLVLGVTGGNQSQRYAVNLGGDGGAGGTGGAVRVTNKPADTDETGWIVTEGAGSHGIMAQSIGGGGGNGSSIVSVQGLVADTGSTVAGLNVGGTGGTGESGGDVTVENEGIIQTSGDGAHGIIAQSVGGGGGNGGLVLAMNSLITTDDSAPLISVGGFGADGGDGGKVVVSNSGTILTQGANAHGVVAQSIGGGGGNANMVLTALDNASGPGLSGVINGLLGAVGGGTGGAGGEVVVIHSGDITVLGDGSVAIKAESINGGGGTLALDLDGVKSLPGAPVIGASGNPEVPDTMVVARAGAQGAAGMNAGKVTVNSTGTFGAAGNLSFGDLAQAIGGGGGTVDVRARLGADNGDPDAVPLHFELALGGQDGTGNRGGDILASQTGEVVTTGLLSAAVLSQSIGGGGGVAVGNFLNDTDAAFGDIRLELGALGSQGEQAGNVVREQIGRIATTGDRATAALLQSIGAGGGASVASVSGAAGNVGASLGAKDAAGGHGGSVEGIFSGAVTTGDGSVGLMLQSIGAGGGDVRVAGTGIASVSLGGSNHAEGDGGMVSLVNDGAIVTAGAGAHGVLLQSIGGGGGSVFGADSQTTVALNSENRGNGGAVSFTQSDEIVVLGDDAYGVIAQSLGGGGGWVDGIFAGSAGGEGSGGAIGLDISDLIFAAGANSIGVFAQSRGQDGAGDIAMTLGGLVRGGSGRGAAVVVDGGADNHLLATGSLSAVSGWAVRGSDGNDTVESTGLTIGNVDLGSGENRFLNRADAVFMAFDTIGLGDGAGGALPAAVADGVATFTNDGTFLMGLSAPRWAEDLASGYVFPDFDDEEDPATNLLFGSRVVSEVALDGNFVQTDAGHMEFDVAFGPYASDRVNVTGDALVAGNGRINLMWLENARPVTLFATEGQGVDNGLSVPGTLALDYGIVGDEDGIHLTVQSDFGREFLRPNERRLGAHMDSALQVGDASGIGRLMAALGNMEEGQEELYKTVFGELNPEGHVAPLHTQYRTAAGFRERMLECRWSGSDAENCLWADAGVAKLDQKATQDYWGATSRTLSLRTGFEHRLEDGWSVSGALGYNRMDRLFVDDERFNGQGHGFDVGFGARRAFGNGFDLAFTATGGWQWYDTTRSVNVFEPGLGTASGNSGYGQLSAEIGYTAEAESLTLRPALAFTGTALHTGSYAERGLGGIGVRMSSHTQYIGEVEPKLSLGYRFEAGDGVEGLLSLSGGWAYRSTDMIETPISFIGASTAAAPAMIATPLDRSNWKIGASAELQSLKGWSVEAGYQGQFGSYTDVHSGSVSLRWKF